MEGKKIKIKEKKGKIKIIEDKDLKITAKNEWNKDTSNN